jgi:AmiR/NasT family two-component response regulator
LSENLEQAMKNRAVIEQAQGIIMARMGCDAGEAIRVMAEQSENQKITLRDLAAELVRDASRKSRVSESG